jgi:16S rRNA (cytosine1402-N4)-methyltransferase
VDVIHTSVLPREVLELLAPDRDDTLFVDATLGEGGHSELFLQRFPSLHVIALDADAAMLARARKRLAPHGDRVEFRHAWFDQYFREYHEARTPARILFDLGISMVHFEQAGRGFSFRRDEVLDMRLDPATGRSAADIVNTESETELARIIFEYGEERYARSIARKIVAARVAAQQDGGITRTAHLASVISSAVPGSYRRGRIHPATRTFQALRIAVNQELDRLEQALAAAFRVLEPGGRIGVIAFHSLEDRIVKRFISGKARACICPPEMPICECGGVPAGRSLTRKPVRPAEDERESNPASRSAKFRVLEKLVGGRPE